MAPAKTSCCSPCDSKRGNPRVGASRELPAKSVPSVSWNARSIPIEPSNGITYLHHHSVRWPNPRTWAGARGRGALVREGREMYSGGYTGKVLRVDLTHQTFSEEELPAETARDFIGG